jgi:hypothetical protein
MASRWKTSFDQLNRRGAALRELIFQTVHDSRDPVFDQIFLGHSVVPEKRDSRQSAKGANEEVYGGAIAGDSRISGSVLI